MNEFAYFLDAIPSEKIHPFEGVIWSEDIIKEESLANIELKFKECLRSFEGYIMGIDKNDDRRIAAERTTKELIEACHKAEKHRLVLEYCTDKKTNTERVILEMALHNGIGNLIKSMKSLEIEYSSNFISELYTFAKDIYYITPNDEEIKANRFWLRTTLDVTIGENKQKIIKGSITNGKSKTTANLGDIFRSPWKENTADFERILESNGYINAGQWVGESKNKTELAELYYCLKGNDVIAQGKESNQLNLLYNRFGLTVGKDNTKNGEYCTLRALKKADGLSDTKDQFNRIFKRWIDQHFG